MAPAPSRNQKQPINSRYYVRDMSNLSARVAGVENSIMLWRVVSAFISDKKESGVRGRHLRSPAPTQGALLLLQKNSKVHGKSFDCSFDGQGRTSKVGWLSTG